MVNPDHVQSSEEKPLSAQGYMALAQNAAFHCRYESEDVKIEEDENNHPIVEMDDKTANNANYETKLLQLAALNQQTIQAFRQLFPSVGCILTFRVKCVTLTWLYDDLAFKNAQNLIKFLQIVKPKIHRIDFIKTGFSRINVLAIGAALSDATGGSCIDKDTFLCFKESDNENACASLIEVLTVPIRRVEVDDEFFAHLIRSNTDFDYVKVKLSQQMDLCYVKRYFDISTRELDIHRVATVDDALIFDFHLFNMKPNPRIESLRISIDSEATSKTIDEFIQYLRLVTPNLKKLTLVHGFGLNFRSTSNLETLNTKIYDFATNFVRQLTTDFNAQIELQFDLEVSVYKSDAASISNINWLKTLKHRFLDKDPREILTELNTLAFSFQLDGPLDRSKILVRVHPTDGEFASDKVVKFPHNAPLIV
ncbi:hypothetical protein M3Y98_00840400 [Aphelenchoides besseyi]|nr:hypothetical protein M3Y98_00840400 [Aphelenchoides besseyi]